MCLLHSEIQVQAAAFLARAQAEQAAKAKQAEEEKKPKLTLPPPPLAVAATAAVDAKLKTQKCKIPKKARTAFLIFRAEFLEQVSLHSSTSGLIYICSRCFDRLKTQIRN